MIRTKMSIKVKVLKSDRSPEYITQETRINFLKEKGIVGEYSEIFAPEQNGKAETLNRTLAEKARAMLVESTLSPELWGEAILTVNYLRNVSPCSANSGGKTPHEVWKEKKFNVSNLRPFGCDAWVFEDLAKQFSGARQRLSFNLAMQASRTHSIEQ